MTKPVFGLALGGFLGIFDGLTARSLAIGVGVGVAVGVFLAFLVALGNHYYWQMMLPGGVLGLIVGYATMRHGGGAQAAPAQ
jgi:hypothetical protein